MQKRKFCIGRVKGNFLWQPYTIWTEWRLNSLNMKWMANLGYSTMYFRIQEYYYILQLSYKGKGVSVEENLMYIILNIHTAKFEFSFLSLVNCPSQFLSHWETLFCSKELSFLCYKNQNKSTIFSSGRENSNCCMLKIIH